MTLIFGDVGDVCRLVSVLLGMFMATGTGVFLWGVSGKQGG